MANQADDDDFEFDIEDDEVEVEDDTPEMDRGREPMPKEIVEELENDELEDYSDKVKVRLKQMKKVWHDERREKERESREKNEALNVAQRMLEENRRLRATLSQGESTLVQSFQQSTGLELEQARREYKEAYESGDSDMLVAAQEKLQSAQYRAEQLKNYRPTLQDETDSLQQQQTQNTPPRPDQKTLAWQERNTWYGTDSEMTAAALGLHQKLERENGATFVGTDEYWKTVDNTMRRRFPEYFGPNDKPAGAKPKSATVVAPATRSTSSKKIVLKQSQLAIAKRLGLTPEQYAREAAKIGN